MLSGYLKRLARLTWSVTAFALVTAAVVVTVARLLLPTLGQYREEVQTWVSRYVNQPVAIEDFRASWRGWTPELYLTNIRLLDQHSERVITRFEHASLGVNLLASLRARHLVPGKLVVSGVRLSLLRSRDGAIRIEGVDPERTEMPGQRQNALADWLQNQRDLSIESATISWRDERTLIRPVVFSNVQLHIRSDGKRRQLIGRARLPDEVGRLFEFRIDANGDLLTTAWSGRMYAEGQGINPSVLLNYSNWLGLHIADGKVGFRLWSDWDNAMLRSVQGTLEATDIAVGGAAQRFVVEAASSRLQASRDEGGRWAVELNRLNLRTRNGTWPESDLALTVIPAAGGNTALVARAGFLRLDDVGPILPGIDAIPANIRAAVEQVQPRGELRDLRLGYFPERPADQRFYVHGQFADVMTRPARGWPGVNGLRGSLRTDAAAGRLQLQSESLQLDFAERFEQPLWLQRLTGTLAWERVDQGWRAWSDTLKLEHAALAATLSGEVTAAEGGAPQADVIARFDAGDIEAVRDLVPRQVLPERGYRWLRTALQGGRLISGGGVIRGPLADFPFDNAEGVFKLRFEVEDALLEFHPAWPRLEQADAAFEFVGRRLSVKAPRATLLGMTLQDVDLSIPDLSIRQRKVIAHGRASGTAAAAIDVIAASPLQARLGERLGEIDIGGELDIDLALEIPLLRGSRPHSKGWIRLPGNRIRVHRPAIVFNSVAGRVNFDGPEWRSEQLTAQYLERPVDLALSGGRTDDTPWSRYRMSGSADRALVLNQLGAASPQLAESPALQRAVERISGSARWTAELTANGGGAARHRQLRVHSELEGLALDLPAPLGKPAGALMPFSLDTTLDGPQGSGRLSLRLGDGIALELLRAQDKPGFSGAALGLGDGEPPAPEAGTLRIAGHLEHLSVSRWMALRDALQPAATPAAGSTPTPAGTALAVEASFSIEHLEAGGREFESLAISAERDSTGWNVGLAGPDIAGNVLAPAVAGGQPGPVQIALERLHIGPRADPPPDYLPSPQRIPALTLTSDSTRFENLDLGHTRLSTEPIGDGLRLASLQVDSARVQLSGAGDWLERDGQHSSAFDIAVGGDDFGQLLAAFGYDSAAIEGGDTELRINAAWDGTPAQFTLDKLRGTLELRVDEGRLLNVDPKAGRLFGLISLQSIKRRLTLDFADLFRKGFSFDRIRGAFELDGGNAYTNNLVMDGPSARIEITGRTGLSDKDYDQVVTVTPQLAGSLPVASAFFGPAGAGVGAVLFIGQKVFKSLPEQLDKMLSRQYVVTGDWEDPVVEQVKGLDLSFDG